MEIYNFNYKIKKNKFVFKEQSTLLIGEFNLFHIGHEELLNKAKEFLPENKIGITIFQTDNNKNILSIVSRLTNLSKIGFDFVILINFNFEFKTLKANDFIYHIINKYNVKNIVVGQDFRFGINRMWGVNELSSYFKNTFICNTKKINKIKISSSGIIEMITTGEIGLINELLLTPYNPVIKYQNKEIIWNNSLAKPHSGIYYIKIAIDNYWYHGLLHIAMKSKDNLYLLNYQNDLINKDYTILILKESRIIVNSRMDNIIDIDKKNCLEFFYLLQIK